MMTLLLSDLDDPNKRGSEIARRAASLLAAMDREAGEFYDLTQDQRDELRDLVKVLEGLADRFRILEATAGLDVSHITRPAHIGDVLRRLREIAHASPR